MPGWKDCELFVVATPIGNLEDITYRAVSVLSQADLILCEDTRVTGTLLHRYQIKKKMQRCNASNEFKLRYEDFFTDFPKIALVTDSGTPGISDPGKAITGFCHSHGIKISVIPGPCAAIAALSCSGFSSKNFLFFGFLPNRKQKRKFILQTLLADEKKVLIFYESPYRLLNFLQICVEINPELPMVIGRELTKIYEEIIKKNANEFLNYYENLKIRGELVILVDNT